MPLHLVLEILSLLLKKGIVLFLLGLVYLLHVYLVLMSSFAIVYFCLCYFFVFSGPTWVVLTGQNVGNQVRIFEVGLVWCAGHHFWRLELFIGVLIVL